MKTACLLFCLLFQLTQAALAWSGGRSEDMPPESGWELMPAGGRRAYKGIHGGTMPVSLLVSPDGQSLFTFVGRTGNDFLQLLRDTDVPLPSLLNATMTAEAMSRGSALLAGGPANSMPVLPFAAAGGEDAPLMHFGLSAKPLSIEGTVEKPDKAAGAQKFRISFNRRFFQPRTGLRKGGARVN